MEEAKLKFSRLRTIQSAVLFNRQMTIRCICPVSIRKLTKFKYSTKRISLSSVLRPRAKQVLMWARSLLEIGGIPKAILDLYITTIIVEE